MNFDIKKEEILINFSDSKEVRLFNVMIELAKNLSNAGKTEDIVKRSDELQDDLKKIKALPYAEFDNSVYTVMIDDLLAAVTLSSSYYFLASKDADSSEYKDVYKKMYGLTDSFISTLKEEREKQEQ